MWPPSRRDTLRSVRSSTTTREAIPRPAILDTEDRVLLWRISELDRAGFNGTCAVALALAKHVDLHVAADLMRRGCPVDTALRILL